MTKQNYSSDELFATALGFSICLGMAWIFIYAMLWSLEEEQRLGISGRSSESLLIEHERQQGK